MRLIPGEATLNFFGCLNSVKNQEQAIENGGLALVAGLRAAGDLAIRGEVTNFGEVRIVVRMPWDNRVDLQVLWEKLKAAMLEAAPTRW